MRSAIFTSVKPVLKVKVRGTGEVWQMSASGGRMGAEEEGSRNLTGRSSQDMGKQRASLYSQLTVETLTAGADSRQVSGLGSAGNRWFSVVSLESTGEEQGLTCSRTEQGRAQPLKLITQRLVMATCKIQCYIILGESLIETSRRTILLPKPDVITCIGKITRVKPKYL